jgi:hypothetical protein
MKLLSLGKNTINLDITITVQCLFGISALETEYLKLHKNWSRWAEMKNK